MSEQKQRLCFRCHKPVGFYEAQTSEGNGEYSHYDCYYLAQPFKPAKKFEDLLRSDDIARHVMNQFVDPICRELLLWDYNRLKKEEYDAFHARLRESQERDNRTDQAGQARAGTAAQDEEIVS